MITIHAQFSHTSLSFRTITHHLLIPCVQWKHKKGRFSDLTRLSSSHTSSHHSLYNLGAEIECAELPLSPLASLASPYFTPLSFVSTSPYVLPPFLPLPTSSTHTHTHQTHNIQTSTDTKGEMR